MTVFRQKENQVTKMMVVTFKREDTNTTRRAQTENPNKQARAFVARYLAVDLNTTYSKKFRKQKRKSDPRDRQSRFAKEKRIIL